MAEKDYTKDSKKWPPTKGHPDWQLAKKKETKSSESIWKQGKGGSGA